MFVQLRTISVQKGNADEVVKRFGREGAIELCEGYIDTSVMVKKAKRQDEHEEVVVMVRWRSEEDWKNWEKSDAHIQGHRQNRGKTPPEYVVGSTHGHYDVKAFKGPK